MNEDIGFIYKIRQILNQGTVSLDTDVQARLHQARQIALAHREATATNTGFVLAGFSSWIAHQLYGHARSLAIVIAISVGTAGIYYWNSIEQAQERDEIDSALLTDELPPSAYLDPGFQAWLDPTSSSSSQ
jgi:hypothetical protein